MINDDFKLTGALSIEKNGTTICETRNLIVTTGKTWVARAIANANETLSHMAVGTGTTAAVIGDTALVAELGRESVTVSGGTVVGTTVVFSAQWAAGSATGSLTEAGLFDAATGGDMVARTVFPVVNKGASDTVTITWTISIS